MNNKGILKAITINIQLRLVVSEIKEVCEREGELSIFVYIHRYFLKEAF